MKRWIYILPIVLLVLVACAPAAEPDNEESVVVSQEATSSPLEAVTEQPTADSIPPTAVLSPPTAVPTDAPPAEPTIIPTDAPVIEPTEAPTEEPAAETAVIAGRLDEGAFFFGDPNAPVTMIDYSDFL